MDLEKLRNDYLKQGYTMANALAKICRDIILSKISKSSLNRNITIKGGIVMHNISGNMRRATRDLDIDFIRYSLHDESIKEFIFKLNDVNDGIKINLEGKIIELHHQDYQGKRVNIKITDKNNFSIYTKLDIGVHKQFDIIQDEYCFNLNSINESVTLFINSCEQIIVEKLKSLLKFGIISTRFKDIFDFYYLINHTKIKKDELLNILNILILSDNSMRQNTIDDIIKDLKIILHDRRYRRNLDDVNNNWLELPIQLVIDSVLNFFKSLKIVSV